MLYQRPENVHLQVIAWSARRQKVATPCVMPKGSKCVPRLAIFLATYQYSHCILLFVSAGKSGA
jgi:hypothetical protein